MISSKNREWEKNRRDKLNESFTTLSKLLPNYDPSIKLSKIEILRNAISCIEGLHKKIKAMGVKEGIQNTMDSEVKTLYERIKKLMQRNEQLCLFIRDAGIKVPQQYANLKQFKRGCRWAKKLTEMQAGKLSNQEVESQKENQEAVTKTKTNRIQNKEKKSLNQKRNKKLVENCKPKPVGSVIPNTIHTTSNSATSQPFLIITNTASLNRSKLVGETSRSTAKTVVTSSASSLTPKVSSIISPSKTQPKQNSNLNMLGPGTLILPNGSFVRLLPQPPPIIIKPPSIPTNKLVILTTTTSIYSKSYVRNVRPKLRPITKTTQVNKVPIPTLVPNRFSNTVSKRKSKQTVKRKKRTPGSKLCIKRAKPNKEQSVTEGEKNSDDKAIQVEEVQENVPEPPLETEQTHEVIETVDKDVCDQIKDLAKDPESTEEVVATVSGAETVIVETPTTLDDKAKPTEDHLELGMNLNSELSNDIFSSLQVPIGGQNPESTSPTAAFLLAFPLVSSLTGVKVTEVIEEENSSSHNGTPTLLQIGTMDTTKTTQSESLTPNLLNLDNFSFFTGYSSFDYSSTTTTVTTSEQKPAVMLKTFPAEETPAKTNFNCIQESTSVTYTKVGIVTTPYIQCDKRTNPHIATTVQCNTFPEFSKPSHTYPTNFTKSYTESVYTNNTTNYNCNQNQYNNNQYYLTKPSTTIAYQQYNYYSTAKTTQAKEKFSPPKNKNQPKPPINWMTTPDFRGNTSDYIVPPVPSFSKDLEYNPNTFYPPPAPVVSTHTNYFNNTNSHEFQQNTAQFEENQFSWSPTKLPQYLEVPHSFVSTTLPTLIGDLALGTTQTNLEQNVSKTKDRNKQRVNNPVNYDANPGNFLSVSQLVEHKTDRTTNRRNGRNLKTSQKLKKLPDVGKDESDKKTMYPNWMESCNNKPVRHAIKNSQSSYSAEALIGVNENPGSRQRYRQNFTAPPNKTLPIPPYLSDNIVPPYFPPVEITQENFMPTNQNYQNFTQNSYLPDFSTTHDYTNVSNRPNNDCSLKKLKHKSTSENLSMDFGFLSMPSSINSPILPDDFHAHTNFLPTPTPNQLYPCKNPLYPKQSTDLLSLPPVPCSRSTTQQFENIPGSSLTNFNLSAIFPEMNKGSGMYSSEPTRNKNYNFHYLGSSVQTTFHNKSTAAPSSYINTTATTFAPGN